MKSKLILLGAAILLNSTMAFAAPQGVSELNELLRGELSAIETYNQALEKVSKSTDTTGLRSSLNNHRTAADAISAEIRRLGGTPVTSSGAWGVWAEAVTGSAKLMGDKVALKALKEGEEHGIKEYREVLEDDDVTAAFKAEVKNKFLPAQQEHIALLNEMMNKL